jgi:predicted ATPase/DNA-binding SARP family transcriptional activator
MGTAPLQIQMLGGFGVSLAGRSVPARAWRLRKAKSLVKLLALADGHCAHRSEIGELLWPERSEASVANNCAQALHAARRALEACGAAGDVVMSTSDGLLVLREPLRIDLEEFESAAARARERRTPDAVRSALALCTGELLPEDRYEDWTTARRDAVREHQLRLLIELAELYAAAGEPAQAIEALQRAVVADPLHEGAHRALMRLFTTCGRRQQALAQYERLRGALRRELEADPDPASRRLYREILSGRFMEHAPASVEERAACAELAPPGNLPAPRTSFIGRERELAELGRLLARTRVLTLTGPGGCGKTRLALELAAAARHRFEHGAWLVGLASVSHEAVVAPAIATALGVQLRSDRERAAVLAEQIGERRMLLLLDNCEHVIDAGAHITAQIVRACPNVVVVATSREPLHIASELVWRVPSLSLPDPARPWASEAVQLFCERAAEVTPGVRPGADEMPAVVEICLRLDGMPLAIELAAARAGIVSPAQIAERLGDSLALLRSGSRAVLTRQQTLEGTLAWSHDLLTAGERILFRRLSVFAGSFDIDAAECVAAGDGIERSDIVELLSRLVDKSLVQCIRHRYRLLETVRQYGRQRLREAGEADRTEAAHRRYYARRADALGATGSPEALEPDHDDLRAALGSALAHDPPAALRMACALEGFWMARGHFAEGAGWLSRALAAAPERGALRGRALLAACALDVRRGAPQRIVELGRESVEIFRGLGDRTGAAWALGEVGLLEMVHSDFDDARRTLEASIAAGDAAVAAAGRLGQGVVAYCQGNYAGARNLLHASLELFADLPHETATRFRATHANPVVTPEGPHGAPRSAFEDTLHTFRPIGAGEAAAYASVNLAEAWRAEGRYSEARASLERALAGFRELDDATGVAAAFNALGNLARSAGEPARGAALLEEALALRRRLGDRRDIGMSLASTGLLMSRAGDAAGARRAIHDALAIFEETEDRPGIAGMWQNLGWIELEAGDPATACDLLEGSVRKWDEQLIVRGAGWSAALLVEAAEAAGDAARALRALQQAIEAFEHVGEAHGLAHAEALARKPLMAR